MRSMTTGGSYMAFQRGDVWLVNYPFSDLLSTKVRPAVICSTDDYHAKQPDLMLVPLTSKIAAATGEFDYVLKDWNAAGLKKESALKPVVATLDPTLAVHRIGTVSEADIGEIEARLRLALGL